ncbi:MAG TPA: enoyl-CoA hydratase-related protein [Rubrivivax sp.]|nr:enoyl-CoA hydratase-related protein [Rubrivivax sp.]
MSESAVLYAAEGGVATLTMNRPQVLNSLDDSLLSGLRETLARAKADPAVRAVLLTGAGRGFCAGADLAASAEIQGQGPGDVSQGLRERYHPIVLAMRQFPKPIVGAVNGVAAGAGMSLALACDIVLAGESASFLQAFTRIGLVPDCGSTWFLPRMVGDVRARALVMLADKISAADALQYGLVWKVYADDQLLAEAQATAARMAQMPTRAYALIKQGLAVSSGNGLGEQLEVEALLQGQAMATEDHREGVTAFLEKRPAQFKGK